MLNKTRGTNVNEINRRRSAYGEFHHLYPDLQVQEDEKKLKRIYAYVTRDVPIYLENRLDQHLVLIKNEIYKTKT